MKKALLILALTASWPSMAHAAAAEEDGAAATDNGTISDIVVTARKRSETAQSVPISLSVATATDLTNRSVISLPDIQQATPSLKMLQSSSSALSSYVSLRGQSVSTVQMSTDLAVGVYIDGVYQPRAYGLETLGTMDISRVEVLKGPQGTLFGKNTTGGAISLYTNTPTDTFEATLRARIDDRGMINVGGMVNIPINETMAARFVASETYRDKLGTNTTTGKALGHTDMQTYRGALSIKPADSVSFLLRGDYMRFSGSGMPFKGVNTVLNPGATLNRALTELGLTNTPANVDTAIAALKANNNFSLDNAQNIDPAEKAEIYGFSFTGDVTLSDTVSLKSITAMRWVRDDRSYDYDGTQFSVFNYPDAGINARQFSQELQLGGTGFAEALNWMVGGYLAREEGSDRLIQISLGGAPSRQEADVVNKTIGFFAQGTFKITPELSFTGGLRYSKDWRNLTSHNRNGTTCTALGASLASIGGAGACNYTTPEAMFDGWSYTAGLDYKPMNGVLLYAKTSRGYRTGGIPFSGGSSSSATAAVATYKPFRPETVTDYEVGIKADWMDGRLRTNLAYYHSNYKDIQRSRSHQVPGTTTIIPLTENIAKAKIDGIEAEITARPVQGLELSGTMAYTNPKYLDYKLPNPSDLTQLLDQTSQPFVMVSKWTYSLSGSYTHEADFGSIRAQIDYSWFSDYTSNIGTLRGLPKKIDDGHVNAHGLVNARLSAKLEKMDMEIAVFGRNLADTRYFVFPTAIESLGFAFNGPMNQPRTIGFEVTKNF